MNMNFGNIRTDIDSDSIQMTVGLYKFFMAHGKAGMVAKAVYEHLIFTARIQKKGDVYANISYIQKGLGLGAATIKKAKTFLKEHGLIEYIQERTPNGKMSKTYIKIFFSRSSRKAESTGGLKTAIPVSSDKEEHKEIKIREEKDKTAEQAQQDSSPLQNFDEDKIGYEMNKLLNEIAKACEEEGYLDYMGMTLEQRNQLCRYLYTNDLDGIIEIFQENILPRIRDGDSWGEVLEMLAEELN